MLLGKGGNDSFKLYWTDDGDGKGGSGDDLRLERPRKGMRLRLLLDELPPVDDPEDIGRSGVERLEDEVVSRESLGAERDEWTLLRKKSDRSDVFVFSLRAGERPGVDMSYN